MLRPLEVRRRRGARESRMAYLATQPFRGAGFGLQGAKPERFSQELGQPRMGTDKHG